MCVHFRDGWQQFVAILLDFYNGHTPFFHSATCMAQILPTFIERVVRRHNILTHSKPILIEKILMGLNILNLELGCRVSARKEIMGVNGTSHGSKKKFF
jgi:hypothetical protein